MASCTLNQTGVNDLTMMALRTAATSVASRAGERGAGAGLKVIWQSTVRSAWYDDSLFLSSVMAAYLATHDLRVITCNGGEATPSYMRMLEISFLIVGKGTNALF